MTIYLLRFIKNLVLVTIVLCVDVLERLVIMYVKKLRIRQAES